MGTADLRDVVGELAADKERRSPVNGFKREEADDIVEVVDDGLQVDSPAKATIVFHEIRQQELAQHVVLSFSAGQRRRIIGLFKFVGTVGAHLDDSLQLLVDHSSCRGTRQILSELDSIHGVEQALHAGRTWTDINRRDVYHHKRVNKRRLQ